MEQTRFAPSPTGHLHLGHVVNALYVWGLARARGWRVRLRIEDHDLERSRPEYEASILADLEWLGLRPDRSPGGTAGPGEPCIERQSDRPGRYEDAAARLDALGLTYWCDCSRERLRRDVRVPEGELRYDGRCRTRGLGPAAGRGLRVRLEAGLETFHDGLLGAQEQDPSVQCGDVLIHDRAGQWTYQFAVTVDDLVDGITHVVRGSDLLPSTGRQIRIARLLGRAAPPSFFHHPLALGPDGRKLSKSHRDAGLRELRDKGLRPDDVCGLAAAAAGLVPAPGPLRVAELADLFR